MSERIFGGFLLLLAVAGIFIGWDLVAPVSYEPVGPRAFPLLVFALLGICAVGLIFSHWPPVKWARPGVLVRVGGMFVTILAYAMLFDKLGFMLSTAMMCVPLALFFGGNLKQAVIGGIGMAVLFFILFDRLLDVALPTGLWLKPFLG